MTLITQNGSAIAAVFTQSWGPVKLDWSPWDSPKGLCNLGQVSGGEYWGHTSAQRYLKNKSPKSILTCSYALSAIKSWSFGIKFHYKKRIHSTFFVSRNDTKTVGFPLWCKVIRQKARQRILRWNRIALWWLYHHTPCSLLVCLVGSITICHRLKLNLTMSWWKDC